MSLKIYNQSRLSESMVAAILDTANRIWTPYSVRFEVGTSPDGIVVIVSADSTEPGSETGRTVLGTTLFMHGHATPYIHLWPGAAEAFAESTAIENRPFSLRTREQRERILLQMMGAALAHELGHYLLDMAQHSREGLMQTPISIRDLAFPDPARLGLTRAQQRLLCPPDDMARTR